MPNQHAVASAPSHCTKSPPGLPDLDAGDLWTPLLFLVFNGGDTLGRCLAALGPWHERSPRVGTLLAYALARLVLVAGQLLCHVVTPRPWRLPDLFRCSFPNLLPPHRPLRTAGSGCRFPHDKSFYQQIHNT